jgi:hypothetical protein
MSLDPHSVSSSFCATVLSIITRHLARHRVSRMIVEKADVSRPSLTGLHEVSTRSHELACGHVPP